MKKSILLFVSVLIIVEISFGQQLPIFSQYQEGDHFTNPALLSNGFLKNELNSTATLIYRNQWTEVKDAPRTFLGRFDHRNDDTNLAYGGTLIYDQTGPTSFMGIYGKVGYSFELNRDWLLSGALSGGIIQYRIKASELNFLEAGDVAQNNSTRLYPDLGLGGALYYRKKYYVGFSIPQIIGLNTKYTDGDNDFNIQRVRHYYGTIGGLFRFNENWLTINTYGKYVLNVPTLVGANIRYDFKNMFWVGTGGSSAGAISIEGGLIFEMGDYGVPLRVGYGLTNYFSEFNLNYGFVHEIRANYSW